MGNEVTEKLVLFLQNLRCEDAGRHISSRNWLLGRSTL